QGRSGRPSRSRQSHSTRWPASRAKVALHEFSSELIVVLDFNFDILCFFSNGRIAVRFSGLGLRFNLRLFVAFTIHLSFFLDRSLRVAATGEQKAAHCRESPRIAFHTQVLPDEKSIFNYPAR